MFTDNDTLTQLIHLADSNVIFFFFSSFCGIDIFVPKKSCIKGPLEKITLTYDQDTVIIPMYPAHNVMKNYDYGTNFYLNTSNLCHLNKINKWIELNKHNTDPHKFKAYTYMQSSSLFIDLKI